MKVARAGGEWSELHGTQGHEAGLSDQELADDTTLYLDRDRDEQVFATCLVIVNVSKIKGVGTRVQQQCHKFISVKERSTHLFQDVVTSVHNNVDTLHGVDSKKAEWTPATQTTHNRYTAYDFAGLHHPWTLGRPHPQQQNWEDTADGCNTALPRKLLHLCSAG